MINDKYSIEEDLCKSRFGKEGKHQCSQIYIGLLVGLSGYASGYKTPLFKLLRTFDAQTGVLKNLSLFWRLEPNKELLSFQITLFLRLK